MIFGNSLSNLFKYALIGAFIGSFIQPWWLSFIWLILFFIADAIFSVIDNAWEETQADSRSNND